MDNFLNKVTGDDKSNNGGGNAGGDIMNKLNGLAGGGAQGEKNEDTLDKGNLILLMAREWAQFCFLVPRIRFRRPDPSLDDVI